MRPRAAGPVMVKVEGLIDPVLADLVDGKVAAADRDRALALALQLDSGGSVPPEHQLDDLVQALEGAEVQTGVWIGPSGSRATDEAVRLVAAADLVGAAGPGRASRSPRPDGGPQAEPSDLGNAEVGDRISAQRAVDLGLADTDSATILGLRRPVRGLPGRGGRRPAPAHHAGPVQQPQRARPAHAHRGQPQRRLCAVRARLALLLFELFTAGVGVAGLVGAGALILGCYGLAVLPNPTTRVALLLFAIFGSATASTSRPACPGVDRHRDGQLRRGVAILYDGVSASWITILLTLVGMTLAMVAGMPTMVRSRFSTPTIGRLDDRRDGHGPHRHCAGRRCHAP